MSRSDAPVKVRSTGHTGITVSDMDRSIRFYRDLLGCEVSDPVQAGVMAVMAVADTAKFDIVRQQKRRY